jgi:hypothetical protein
MAVPYVAMEIQAQRDKYRALREHALALVGWTMGGVGPLRAPVMCRRGGGHAARAGRGGAVGGLLI